MEEITLTGGTLMASSGSPASLGASAGATGHGAHCSHNHDHGHKHGHGHNNSIEMSDMSAPLGMDDLVDAPVPEVLKALSTLVRFGRYEAVAPLVQKFVENRTRDAVLDLLKGRDEGGHSLLHWASKRVDDLRFLQTLVDLASQIERNLPHTGAGKKTSEILNLPSDDSVGMLPLHWACTGGSLPHVALLLQHGADIEAKDKSGCTPLLIAAQYGQVDVVAYLLQKGANGQAVDSSRDSALHWAAYKGSIPVCGLLSFYQTLEWTMQDAYEQTPLHLAALRGHTSIVRYALSSAAAANRSSGKSHSVLSPAAIARRQKELLYTQDKNNRTPLDLAIHKQRPNVEAVLREAMSAFENPSRYWRTTLISSLKDCTDRKKCLSWLGLTTPGMDESDTPPKVPYYFVLANYVIHAIFVLFLFAPMFNVSQGLLWDHTSLLLWNAVTMVGSWFMMYKTTTTSPGFLDQSHPQINKWRRLYETTLESYANADADLQRDPTTKLPLCHTCHIARPLRSKHCRVTRKCVLLFDHYCPFVNNTIGLENYKWFYGFLTFTVLSLLLFTVTFTMYIRRYVKVNGHYPVFTLLLGIEVSLTILIAGGLWIYHTQLTMVNLSTNEHINVRKYKYLYPPSKNGGKRQYRNPWFKGFFGNFMDRMNPSEACYTLPDDSELWSLLSSENEQNTPSPISIRLGDGSNTNGSSKRKGSSVVGDVV